MNDATSPESPATRASRKYLPAIVVGIAAIVLIGFLASRSGLDKALIRQQLDGFAARLHDAAAKQGRDVTFTYGEVGIEGSFSHKHGVIHDPKLTIKPLNDANTQGDDVVVLTTPVAEIYATSADLSALEIRLPQPLDFTNASAPDKKLLTIKAAEPLVFDVAQIEENKIDYIDFRHPAPSRLDFTYLREHQAAGTEDATPTLVPVYQNLALTIAPGGSIHTHLSADGRGLGTSVVDWHDIHVIPESVPNGEIKIAEITENASNTLNDKGQRVAALKLHIGDITASPDFIPYAPMSLSLDGSYAGAPTQTPEDVASAAKQQTVMKLTEFALSTKDAKLTATADFATNAGDALPEGTANVTLTNVPYVWKELTDNGVLNATNAAIVAPVLEMVTGQKLADIKDAVIDIKRPHGGSFMIGKATFEELFATVLKSAMTQKPPAPATSAPGVPATGAPAAPDVKKAPLKGAMKVEDSARG